MSLLDKQTKQAIVDRILADRVRQPEFLKQMEQRQKQGWTIARQAANILKTQFGVTRVVLFGSMLDPKAVTWLSDIDLAVWELTPSDLFKAGAAIERGHDFEIDLVPVEAAKPYVLEAIEQGIDL